MTCSVLLLLGCGKQRSSPPASEPAAAAAAANASEVELSLALLTQAVRKYSVEQRRVPKTLEELVSAGYLGGVPPAPAGKRFAINQDLKVYLADR